MIRGADDDDVTYERSKHRMRLENPRRPEVHPLEGNEHP